MAKYIHFYSLQLKLTRKKMVVEKRWRRTLKSYKHIDGKKQAVSAEWDWWEVNVFCVCNTPKIFSYWTLDVCVEYNHMLRLTNTITLNPTDVQIRARSTLFQHIQIGWGIANASLNYHLYCIAIKPNRIKIKEEEKNSRNNNSRETKGNIIWYLCACSRYICLDW